MRRYRSTGAHFRAPCALGKEASIRHSDMFRNSMRDRASINFVVIVLFVELITAYCIAGDAAFSSDGKKIYSITNIALNPAGKTYADQKVGPAAQEIDLEAKTIRLMPTAELRGIACTADNKLFCTTAKSLYSFDPSSGALKKIRDAESGTQFWRIAYNPKLDWIFVTTDDEKQPLFMFKDPAEWTPVRMRRHSYPSCLVFAKNGELFFAAYGDLWHGEIEREEEGTYSLIAYRYAPLATLETQNTTPAEIGVEEIGVSRDAVYVELARMGGSGDGWFAQLARPKLKRDADGNFDIAYDPKERLPVYQRALQSLKILGEDFRAGQICVSPDERQIYYVLHGKHWLVRNDKTEELHLTSISP